MDKGTGFPAQEVLMLIGFQRFDHIVPVFEDLCKRHGVFATPGSVSDTPDEPTLQRPFTNVWCLWTGGLSFEWSRQAIVVLCCHGRMASCFSTLIDLTYVDGLTYATERALPEACPCGGKAQVQIAVAVSCNLGSMCATISTRRPTACAHRFNYRLSLLCLTPETNFVPTVSWEVGC